MGDRPADLLCQQPICPTCQGAGKIGTGPFGSIHMRCPDCQGTGKAKS